MPGGKSCFNNLWLCQDIYKNWLGRDVSKNKAMCVLCNKSLDISVMGESALKVHMQGKKHTSLSDKSWSIKRFLRPADPDPLASSSSTTSLQDQSELSVVALPELPTSTAEVGQRQYSDCSLTGQLPGKDTLKAEVLWALKCVDSKFSYNSCTDINHLFTCMFPDSEIAKKFSCGERKCAYLCCFGIAPHFKNLLFECLKTTTHYVMLFDETLNSSTQSKQMDLLVRFWHPKLNAVHTRYLTSVFIGHATATDIVNSFKSAVDQLDLSKMLQVSMDGPAVNWKFFEILQKVMKNDYNHQLLNVGSCGLHVLHNSLKGGEAASGWNLDSFLISLYYLFKDCPARLEDFMTLSETKQKKTGLKFCNHRWLDNIPATTRALEIWDDLKLYVSSVEKGKVSKPNNKSYHIVYSALQDKLMLAKLNFFLCISKIVQPFLTLYQSDTPLLPFLATDLTRLVRNCLSTFSALKEEKMKCITTAAKLAEFEFSIDTKNDISKFSMGFAADRILKELVAVKSVSEKDVFQVKHEAMSFIFAFVKKILQKSPLKYAFVRNLACLDPKKLASDKESCRRKMKSVVSYLADCNLLRVEDCDAILLEFKDFAESMAISTLQNFDPTSSESNLDVFFHEHMCKPSYNKVWNVVKMLLILSHGQATIERGFSINKQMEVENLKESSYVSLRIIQDHIKFCGGILQVPISKELINSSSSARRRYMTHLEDEKKKEQYEIASQEKRKRDEELSVLKQKRKCLEADVHELTKSADELSEQAETKREIQLCIKSNSLRKTAREKQALLDCLDKQIDEKSKALKN